MITPILKSDYTDSHRCNHFLKICGIIAAFQALFVVSAAAQPRPDVIRVAVAQNNPEVSLQIQGRFIVLTLQTGHPIQEGRRLRTTAVRGVPEGLSLGGEVLPVHGVRIEPVRDAAITLNGKRLRGALEIVRQQDLTLLVINHVSLEDYLRGVVSKEAPDYWPQEALKAIAVAARTYALYQRLTKEDVPYDVTGDVMSQDYGGKTSEKFGTTNAVRATAGQVLTYRGAIFPPFYHSTCGGVTEHGRAMGKFDIEPLRGGIVCELCQASPVHAWRRRLTKADVAWALRKSPHGAIGAVRDVRVLSRTPAGRAQDIAIFGALRTLKLSGYEFRALFGFDRIRSPFFTIEPIPDGFLLSGRGWGHGVGLCQWGASEMARRGFSAREILAFYYPQSELAELRDLMDQPLRVIGGE